MRKTAAILLLAVFAALLFAACTSKEEQPQSGARTYADYIDSGKIIGVQSGEVFNLVARDLFKAKQVPEYMAMSDLLEALRRGRVDAVMTDGSYVKQLEDSGMFPEFDYLWVDKEVFVNESAPVFYTAELRDAYNEWLAGVKADGTFDEIMSRWIGVSLPAQEDIPRFDFTGENGTLRVCNTGNYPPFSYFDANGRATGFDIDLMSRFALHLGMDMEVQIMSYDAIIPYVISGRADMSACQFTVTDERGESVLFGAPTIVTQSVLIVPKGAGASADESRPLDYTAFAGKDIAVITGALTYNTAQKIDANPVNYNDSASAAEDVRKGRVAGYMHALTAIQVMASQLDGFEAIPVPKELFSAQVAGISHDQAVIDRFNAFLAAIEADGTLGAMQSRWFGAALDLDAPIPEIENAGQNGVIRAAICSDSIPYVYAGANGQYSGFSVELVLRFGAYEGKRVEFTDMEFGGLIPYIVGQRADIALANMAVTEERKQSVLFTDPFFDEQHGILALAQGAVTAEAGGGTLDYTDFFGKTIGIPTGYIFDVLIENDFSGTVAYYSETSAGVEDVRQGRIAGFMTDFSIAGVVCAQPGNENLHVIPVPHEVFSGPLGAVSMNQDIIGRFNTFLAEIKDDGTLAEMQRRWIEGNPGSDPPMPDIPLSGQNGVLRAAIGDGSLPFCYIGANGEIKGYSAELILRFAAREGMSVEFITMEFAAIIPYIVSDRADIGIDAITITEERKKSVLFTDSVYDDRAGIIALKPAAPSGARDYSDFFGKRIGVSTGSFFDSVTENELRGIPVYYNNDGGALEDVRNGRIDGVMLDYSSALVMGAQPGNEVFEVVGIPLEIYSGPMGSISMDQDLIDRYNDFLLEIKASGVLAEMQRRWIEENPGSDPPMPDIPLTGENGNIKVVTSGLALPFSYIGENGAVKGYCVELAIRFAAREKMSVEFVTTDFPGMIPYVVSGRADIGIDAMTITEERKQSVLFSDPHYSDRVGIMALRKGEAPALGYADFAGQKIGIITGTLVDKPAEEILNTTSVYYQDSASAIEDIRNGRIGGMIYDLSSSRIIAGLPGNEDLQCVEIPREVFFVPMGAVSGDPDIIGRFNNFLKALKDDGALAVMQAQWLETMSALDAPMPEIPLSDQNGVLRIVVDDAAIPFAYRGGDGELRGFCVELGTRFAAHEGMGVEFVPMDFGSFIPYLSNGKADIGIDAITITDERKETILFTDPFYDGPLGILTLRRYNAPPAQAGRSFMDWVKTGIERNLITDNRWKMIVDGLGVTMTIALLAQIFGTLFGCFLCWLLTRKNKAAKWLGGFYCGLIHGTPIVVLLMITYYIIFGGTSVSNVLIAVAAFTMVTGAGIAQNLKGAIDTVDPVEIEAARSIGFPAFKAFRTVTLPQAVKRALPGYTNGFVELVKATAIVGYIAIQDLTRAGDIIRSRTYDAYFPLLFVAAIYLVVTTVCIQLFKLAVKRFSGETDRGRRPRRMEIASEIDRRQLRMKGGDGQ